MKDSKIYTCDTILSLLDAIVDIGFESRVFRYVTGLSDPITDEYAGFLFTSTKITNNPCADLPPHTTGKMLVSFLLKEMSDPTVKMYPLTKNGQLGGWELMGVIANDKEYVLSAERILLGSTGKSN